MFCFVLNCFVFFPLRPLIIIFACRNKFFDQGGGRGGEVSNALEDVDDVSDLPSDSWIASTATFAIGMLVDLCEVHFFKMGIEGRSLFDIVFNEGIIGFFDSMKSSITTGGLEETSVDEGVGFGFVPSESLLRICVEQIRRLPHVLMRSSRRSDGNGSGNGGGGGGGGGGGEECVKFWFGLICTGLSKLLNDIVDMQRNLGARLVKEKKEAEAAAAPIPRVHQDFLAEKMQGEI